MSFAKSNAPQSSSLEIEMVFIGATLVFDVISLVIIFPSSDIDVMYITVDCSVCVI